MFNESGWLTTTCCSDSDEEFCVEKRATQIDYSWTPIEPKQTLFKLENEDGLEKLKVEVDNTDRMFVNMLLHQIRLYVFGFATNTRRCENFDVPQLYTTWAVDR